MKKLFTLNVNGVELHTLENLREQFDAEKIVEYFKNGKLIEWLADRFYEDEVDALQKISADDEDFQQKICVALGVEEEDPDFIQRIFEKKIYLASVTSDPTIVDNAEIVALNQEDLADLLYRDYKIILLCGDIFRIPAHIPNKKYIGILGTPKIKIRAISDAELDEKNISFENCMLAWKKIPDAKINSQKKVLRDIFEVIFGTRKTWSIVGKEKIFANEPDQTQKQMFLKLVCGGYSENDLIHLCAAEDFSAGWALTDDAFCLGGNLKFNSIDNEQKIETKHKIFYNEIAEIIVEKTVESYSLNFIIADKKNNLWRIASDFDETDAFTAKILDAALGENNFLTQNIIVLNEKIETQIAKFLSFVKN